METPNKFKDIYSLKKKFISTKALKKINVYLNVSICFRQIPFRRTCYKSINISCPSNTLTMNYKSDSTIDVINK